MHTLHTIEAALSINYCVWEIEREEKIKKRHKWRRLFFCKHLFINEATHFTWSLCVTLPCEWCTSRFSLSIKIISLKIIASMLLRYFTPHLFISQLINLPWLVLCVWQFVYFLCFIFTFFFFFIICHSLMLSSLYNYYCENSLPSVERLSHFIHKLSHSSIAFPQKWMCMFCL